MKPRNKHQRMIVEMASRLRPLNDREKEYAKSLFPAEALYFSRRGNHCEFHCMCCGAVVPELGKWPFDDFNEDTWTCPECGAECKVCPQYSGGFSRNMNRKTGAFSVPPTGSRYITLLDTHGDYQVLRTFEFWRSNGRTTENGIVRGLPTEFYHHEIYQNWIDSKGGETIVSKSYQRSFNYHNWDYASPWGIGTHNAHCSGYYMMGDVYDNTGNFYFPKFGISRTLRRNGLNTKVVRTLCPNLDIGTLAIKLLTDNTYEELVKTGQLELVRYFLGNSHGRRAEDHLQQIRICTRHGYKVKDANLWLDYVHDLMYLGLDTHSPHYLCPENLAQAHARTQRRRERLEAKREAAKDIEIAKKYEKEYSKQKRRFFGIAFGDDKVTISVIPTVEGIRQEGAAMHHCVFRNGYYKYKNSVILSARDKYGNRLETIEIGLKPLTVLQSRGLQNLPTPEHERIVALCTEHLRDFQLPERKRKIA